MGMLKAAMSDMAETIRRVFQDPGTTRTDVAFGDPAAAGVMVLEARLLTPAYRFEPRCLIEAPIQEAREGSAPMSWAAAVRGEPGWASWTPEAAVCALPLFKAEKCQRLLVPALPRRGVPRRAPLEAFGTRPRSGWATIAAPQVRGIPTHWPAPQAREALAMALALPMAVVPQDLGKLSKAIWMRYTLQLVRSTGQNIRNLDILGLYLIPSKGILQVRHEPATGRLLVNLGPEALKCRKAPFILARQKDDNAVVCCFVEET